MKDLDEYLPAIAAGDKRSFGLWMSGAERSLRLSLRSFATSVDTEAVIQETLLRVWQVAPRVKSDGRGNSLLRMATRIAKNLAISETRRTRADLLDTPDLERAAQSDQPTEAAPTDPLLRKIIAACKERLPKKPLAALEARLQCRGAERDDALAARLGMKKNTFLQNFGRARKFLAECLRKNGIDLEQELG